MHKDRIQHLKELAMTEEDRNAYREERARAIQAWLARESRKPEVKPNPDHARICIRNGWDTI